MNVKIIRESNGSALIEWIEESQVQRAWMPIALVMDGECLHPEYGIPYGDDFAEVQPVTIGPEDIQRALRKHGIWTYAELSAHPTEAHAALQELVGAVLRPLLRAAKARR